MRKILITLVVVALLLGPAGAAQAATSQDVTVYATPSYISIANSPSTKDFGTVSANSTYWSNGSAPTFPLDDTECFFSVNNTSSVNIAVTINTVDWTGGVGWTCADNATPSADTFGMYAGASGISLEGDMVIVKKTETYNTLKTTTTAGEDFKWEFKLLTPTEFTDSVQKTGTVTLTATAS